MMMANRYLVKLTPIGKYYFGSENSFNAIDKANNSIPSTNYLVRSREYPQQTTLLGMMRYAILQQYQLLGKDKSTWASKIGISSFQGNGVDINGHQTNNWGLITSISPLFLVQGENKFVPAGLDNQFYLDDESKEYGELLLPMIKEEVISNYNPASFRLLNEYDPKVHSLQLWINQETNEFIKPCDIFKESFQVGIKKSRSGTPENDGFYKEYFFQLQNDFSFAFYLTTNEIIEYFNNPFIIQSGGDQSLFQVHLTAANDDIFETLAPTGTGKITLLSDSYCNADEILPLCTCCITQNVDFRYLQTTTSTEAYSNLGSGVSGIKKSIKMNLLERGSVLYTLDANALSKLLEQPTPYRNAGFNYYSFKSLNT